MLDQIRANAEQLVGDGRWIAETAFESAVSVIDGKSGQGFAKTNPELVAALLTASAASGSASVRDAVLQDGLSELASAIREPGDAIGDLESVPSIPELD